MPHRRLLRGLATAAALWLGLAPAAIAGPMDEVFPEPVEITAEDIAWFRGGTVEWLFVETGSPGILPPAPDLDAFWEAMETGTRGTRFERVYLAFMIYGDLPNGTFGVDPARFSETYPFDLPETLTVTDEHRRLLARAWWKEGYIDPKYPFGNYNYTEADIALTLGQDVPLDDSGTFDLPPARETALMALYHELPAVLAIWIAHAELAPGTYRLPVDGWDTYGGLRETPATQADAARYWRARNLLLVQRTVLGPDSVDMVIDWIGINDAFAGRVRQ